jgi:amidase
LSDLMAPLDWKKLVAQELKRRDATFPKWYFELPDAPEEVLDVTPLPEQAGILTEKEIQITRTDGFGVVEKIKNKEWTCVEVTEAFCKRAMLAQKYVSSLSEM